MRERLTELYFKEDLGMYYCGKREETPNHSYGPEIRTHYLFVLVNKGKAVLYQDREISFGEQDLLIMLPNERIHYKALEPWSISWLGLYGNAVDRCIDTLGISPENPILHITYYNELYEIMEKEDDFSVLENEVKTMLDEAKLYKFEHWFLFKATGDSHKTCFLLFNACLICS